MHKLAIEHLTLSHFRSHKFTSIDCESRPVAIYGPNGAGKTNILEALSLLSPGRGLRRAALDEMVRSPENIGWKISARFYCRDELHEVETFSTAAGRRQVVINGEQTTQLMLGKIIRILWLVPAMDRLWIEGAEGRRRFLDRMAMSLEPGHGEAVLAFEKSMRARNKLLKDTITDPAWYNALELQMAKSAVDVQRNRHSTVQRIMDAQQDRKSSFPQAQMSIKSTDEIETVDGFISSLADGRRRDMAAGRTLNGPHRADLTVVYRTKNLPANLCSTGEQKALLIALILANTQALIDDCGVTPILLLDEITAHLDDRRREELFGEINAMKTQAWMTGTGQERFESFANQALRLKLNEENGVSRLGS